MRRPSQRRRATTDHELNITAFMNLMVVLVPFLLITAVFSQLSILELQLPGDASSTPSTPPKGLRLTIEVNDVGVVSVFTHNGPNKTLEQRIASSLDKPISNQLQRILRPIKAQFPSETTATLLVHDQVPYNTLIEVMDATRTTRRIVNGQRISVGLFPDIAIGSLPETSTATSNAQYLNESGGVSG